MSKTFYYAENNIEIPSEELDGMTLEESVELVRTAWQEMYPALERASWEEQDDGSVRFYVRSGSKG
jgi:hypothetical protein